MEIESILDSNVFTSDKKRLDPDLSPISKKSPSKRKKPIVESLDESVLVNVKQQSIDGISAHKV